MKKSSRRVAGDENNPKGRKSKKKYKEIIKTKDIKIKELSESLQRAKDDISNLQTLKFEYDMKMQQASHLINELKNNSSSNTGGVYASNSGGVLDEKSLKLKDLEQTNPIVPTQELEKL